MAAWGVGCSGTGPGQSEDCVSPGATDLGKAATGLESVATPLTSWRNEGISITNDDGNSLPWLFQAVTPC